MDGFFNSIAMENLSDLVAPSQNSKYLEQNTLNVAWIP